MSFLDLFSGVSSLYAAARPTYPEELFRFVASVAPEHDRAWDCATGNGQAARGLVRHFREVEATDASEEQIARARPCPGVRYSVQPAEGTRFEDDAFDAVCVAAALHWLDFRRFFPEVHRVLRPGGVFAAWTYSRMSVDQEIDAFLKEALLDVLLPYWSPRNRLSWNGYRDAPFPFEELPVPPLRIECRWGVEEVLAFIRTWSGTQRCIRERGTAFLEAAGAGLAKRWGEPGVRRLVMIPVDMRAGRHAPAAPVS
jgi:SAM-dependent methyltransferase